MLAIISLSAVATAGQLGDRLTTVVQQEMAVKQALAELRERENSCANLSDMADLAMMVPDEDLAGALEKTELMDKLESCESIYRSIRLTEAHLKSLSLEKALIREQMKEDSVRRALSSSQR